MCHLQEYTESVYCTRIRLETLPDAHQLYTETLNVTFARRYTIYVPTCSVTGIYGTRMLCTHLKPLRDLAERAVVVEAGKTSDVLLGDGGRVLGQDQRVRVGGVRHHHDLQFQESTQIIYSCTCGNPARKMRKYGKRSNEPRYVFVRPSVSFGILVFNRPS